jgi:hypothetical protein
MTAVAACGPHLRWTRPQPRVRRRSRLPLQGVAPTTKRGIALNARTGAVAWVFTPPRLQSVPDGQDPACDFDFGATVNLGSPDRVTKHPRSSASAARTARTTASTPQPVACNGPTTWSSVAAPAVIGTTAFDGNRAYAAPRSATSDPANRRIRRHTFQEQSMHAFNSDGSLAWEQPGAQSVGPTTVAGGMIFSGYPFAPEVQIRDSATGSTSSTPSPWHQTASAGYRYRGMASSSAPAARSKEPETASTPSRHSAQPRS